MCHTRVAKDWISIFARLNPQVCWLNAPCFASKIMSCLMAINPKWWTCRLAHNGPNFDHGNLFWTPFQPDTRPLVEAAVLPSSDASVHDRGLGIGKRRVLLQSFPRCHPRIRIAWPLPEQVGKPERLCEVAQNHWTDQWLLNPVMIRMNPQPGFYNLYLVCLKMRYHHVSLRRLLCRGLLN